MGKKGGKSSSKTKPTAPDSPRKEAPVENGTQPRQEKKKPRILVSKHKGRSLSAVSQSPVLWLVIPSVFLLTIAVLVVILEQWLAGPAVSQPLGLPLVVDKNTSSSDQYLTRLWGSYRSNVYFGMRARVPYSPMVGIMWFTYDGKELNIRHTCEHGQLNRYGWTRHDGATFGQQEILDNNVNMTTDFLVESQPGSGHTWTARIKAESRNGKSGLISFFVYLYKEPTQGEMSFVGSRKQGTVEEIFGHMPQIGQFRFYSPYKRMLKDTFTHYLVSNIPTISGVAHYVKQLLRPVEKTEQWPMRLRLPGEHFMDGFPRKPTLIAYQFTTPLPMEIDLVFEEGPLSPAMSIYGESLSIALSSKALAFDSRFDTAFSLQAKNFSEEEISFAKAVFSNLIGGLSYFYGKSRVISSNLKDPVDYWAAPLFTAVPSRSFFPRGFLWDEGFHQLLVTHWSTDIVKDVIGHWLDLMNNDGWIPREQILGDEARSKVPPEFVVQHDENANPPTFFLTLESLLNQMEKNDNEDLDFLERVFPRLQIWFDWFNITQVGEELYTYRWRGRNGTTDKELNPKTLTSGLDDFPRASHPTVNEYHIDLRCWIALASGVMTRIAMKIGAPHSSYEATYKLLSDAKLLDKLHWDPERKVYSDYGLHTEAVKLVRPPPRQPGIQMPKIRRVKASPTLRFVSSYGYVNLFPMLLKLLPPTSDKLAIMFTQLRDPSLLWTSYGLRSLAKKDPLYKKFNTESDPPYWRGSIWINMNYLAVRALHHYSNTGGPYRQLAAQLYTDLRNNLIRNMFREYQKTGYVWEQYDDKNGSGKGTHPFTGWSSLIVLIMAEKY